MFGEQLHDFWLRLKALVKRRELDRDLDDELQFHLAMREQKLRDQGVAAEEAPYAARRQFGNVTRLKETSRELWGFRSLEILWQDLRYGARMLAKSPGLTVVSILALAIGIAANTVIYTVYNAVELRPIQAVDPGRVVNIYASGVGVPNGQLFSYPDYAYFRDHNTTFSSLIVETETELSWSGEPGAASPAQTVGRPSSLIGIRFFQQMAGSAEFTVGAVVSENYFLALGINPALGRSFTPEDARNEHSVVMLSYDFWKRRFNSDAGILGRPISLDGKPFTVIGITPPGFMGTYPDILNVWIPVGAMPVLEPKNNLRRDPDNDCCRLFGRLKPGVTREQAQSELTVLAEQLRKSYPAGSEQRKPVTITVAPGSPFSIGDRNPAKVIAYLLMGATSLVLLIACANVAGLQLARSAARQKEIGVRLALGAGRSRLVRQLLTEAMMLAVLAGTVGLHFAWWTLRLLLRAVSTTLPPVWGTLALQVDPDFRIFAYTLAVCLGAGILFGLAPALEASKPNLTSVLKEDGGALGLRLGKSRLRDVLVVAQVMISLVLLIAAGLLARGSFRAATIDPGFATRHVLGIDIEIPSGLGYDTTKRGLLARELVDRFRAVPGVRLAARGRAPLAGGVRSAVVSVTATGDKPSEITAQFSYSYVSPDYFKTLDIPILHGRAFTEEEARAGAPVTLISEATARKLWPDKDPLGKRVTLDSTKQYHSSDEPFPTGQAFQVIGVTRDISSLWLGKIDDGYFYMPMPPNQWYDTILVRTEVDPNALIPALSDQVNAVDPNVAVFVETLDGLMTNNPPFIFSRIAAVVSTIIGLLGLVLAAVGIYGMVSFTVVQRTHEVGVRMALGARASDVLAMILRQNMQPVAIGMALGIAISAATSQLLSAMLFGLSALDPAAFLGVSVFLAGVALLASYLPARRATKVDPMVALRYE
jgi:predicted permease